MLGHAGALGNGVGTHAGLSEILHLLAAGARLGGLLPLFIAIGTLPHIAARKLAAASRRLVLPPCCCWREPPWSW